MGERNNISLSKGIHRTPSMGGDGELSECVNLIPKAGELVPVMPPEKVGFVDNSRLDLQNPAKLVGVHSCDGYTHYIIKAGNVFYYALNFNNSSGWTKQNLKYKVGSIPEDAEYYGVKTLGNTVMILTSDGIYYFLYTGPTDSYTMDYQTLGNKIPELEISFGQDLTLDECRNEQECNGLSKAYTGSGNHTMDTEDQEYVSKYIMAVRNKAVKEATEEGYFLFPYLVRYAIVMNDGTSIIHHSAPVLMIPSTDNAYCYNVNPGTNPDLKMGTETYRVLLAKAKLNMMIKEQVSEVYRNWSDVVRGVNIYVSAPFYTYKQDENYTTARALFPELKVAGELAEQTYGGVSYGRIDGSAANDKYESLRMMDMLAKKTAKLLDHISLTGIYFENPAKDITNAIKESSTFYLLKEYSLEEMDSFHNSRQQIEIPESRLSAITAQTILAGDPSHDKLIPEVAYVYNQRLHIAECSRQLVNPQPLWTMLQYMNYDGRSMTIMISERRSSGSTKDKLTAIETAGAYLTEKYRQSTTYKVSGREYIAYDPDNIDIVNMGKIIYIAQPSRYATRMQIFQPGASNSKTDLELVTSEMSDISFCFKDINTPLSLTSTTMKEEANSPFKESYVYSSEVGWPFYIPESSQHSIGSGNVIAMTSATKAITQGQFGDFPMILFTTEGLYAMGVNADGTMNTPQAISRDVCNNADSITQIDDAVLFATEQGLKNVSGETVNLLSGPMEGRNLSETELGLQQLLSGTDWTTLTQEDTTDIRSNLATCKMLYDYANRLIHIYRTDFNKHYVLSLDTMEFGSEVIKGRSGSSPIQILHNISVIPAYPYSIMQVDNEFYQYRGGLSSTVVPGMIISRSMSFGDLYGLKTIVDARIYDNVASGERSKMVILVSNDERHWVSLNSLHGTPFKFCRVVVVTKMQQGDTLSGLVLETEARRSGKLR